SMLDIHLIRHLFPTRWLKIICSPTICFDPHIDQIGETPTLTQMIHGASFGNGAITPLSHDRCCPIARYLPTIVTSTYSLWCIVFPPRYCSYLFGISYSFNA